MQVAAKIRFIWFSLVRFNVLFVLYAVVTKKKQEELHMKTAAQLSWQNRGIVPYPNAATRRQVLEKILDRLLLVVSCIGLATMLLFLLSLA